jgi:hypothetical protein
LGTVVREVAAKKKKVFASTSRFAMEPPTRSYRCSKVPIRKSASAFRSP